MDRSASSLLLSWLLVPVAAVLVWTALSLPFRPYTGLVLHGGRVASVIPGSPGERAGARVGDRVQPLPTLGQPASAAVRPLGEAYPGRPLTLISIRDDHRRILWLVPEPLPDGERHMMAALLAVASGFVLLGGWVWSERRDRLTRVFFLLCLGFAWLLAPLPTWGSAAPAATYEALLTGMALYLPALFIHFFALFPEPRPRGDQRAVVRGAYGLASFLFVLSLAPLIARALGKPVPEAIDAGIQAAAALWFAAGVLVAIVLFATSYRRAGSRDARRRLRVALAGTVLGAGPVAALIAVRNLSPETTIPGERFAMVLTLLVPASFAWSTAVHHIFDFRVALRAAATTLTVALAGALVYVAGEWLAATWWPNSGPGIAGAALAFVVLVAAVAGPINPWLRSFGARLVPHEGRPSLAAWSARELDVDPDGADHVLSGACEEVMRYLRLDGCIALAVEGDRVRLAARAASGELREPGPVLRLHVTRLARVGIHGIEEAGLDADDREALELGGVRWLMPIGADPLRAVLLLGRRLAGSWLSRREAQELERFAEHLAITLENTVLRREATSRGHIDRELEEAGAIQAHLLPRRAPIYPTLDCAAAALSSETVGGDYYDFVEGPGRDFTLAVGDAAGKGVPAALLLAGVQARFRSEARRGLQPGQLLAVLNRELVGLDHPDKFVGLLCARVEVRSGRVWFANAGLTPPLVRRHEGQFEELTAGGVLLGVSRDAFYPDVCVELSARDIAVIYTDGLTEARRGEELFGTERVQQVLEKNAHRRAADILEQLLQTVRAFADRPLDDMTVVVLRQLTDPARMRVTAPQNALKWPRLAADAVG